MKLQINGQIKEIENSATLISLVAQFSKRPDVVITELNGAIIDRTAWPTATLKDGDRIELISFVGGG